MASHYGHQAGWQQDQRRQEIDALIYAAKQAGTHEQIVYWSAEELIRSSPSRADGLDPATEAVWRRSYVCMISEVGAKLKM